MFRGGSTVSNIPSFAAGFLRLFAPQRLSKKNGNYLGKVRTNLKRTEATIFTNDQASTSCAKRIVGRKFNAVAPCCAHRHPILVLYRHNTPDRNDLAFRDTILAG